MDQRLSDVPPSVAERSAVDAVLGFPTSGWDGGARVAARDGHVALGGHSARARRHLLLPALHALQSAVGWISEGGLMYLCARLTVPPAEAWGVATFYGLLATTPRPRRVLHVCDDIACRTLGAKAVIAALEREVGHAHHAPAQHGSSTPVDPGEASWLPSPCLGLCDQAPAALLTVAGSRPLERLIGAVTPAEAVAAVQAGTLPERPRLKLPQQGDPAVRLLRRIGVVDPSDIAAYEASGGFLGLTRAIEIGPAAVIQAVTGSRLMGRGGAAFPTGRKWAAVAGQPEKTR